MITKITEKHIILRRQRISVVCAVCLILSFCHGCGSIENRTADPGSTQAETFAESSDPSNAQFSDMPDTDNAADTESGASAGPTLSEPPSTPTDTAADDTTVTFMVYMDAASLESGDEPFATYDLIQMMEAELSDRVRVIVQTGGTRRWGGKDGMPADADAANGILDGIQTETDAILPTTETDTGQFLTDTSNISSDSTQRYEITGGAMVLLEDLHSQKDMTDPQTLKEFLLFCAEEAPADRYMLLLWGHGRGPGIGYGQDDFQGFRSAMTLTALAEAVRSASEEGSISLELIGFDACLMGCVETVYALRGCCDYLAVSEDYEPAYGWQYTRVFDALSEDPSIPVEQLSQVIVDAYMEEAQRSGDRGILAVVDMQYANSLWDAWQAFYDTNAADIDRLVYQIWHDDSLLSPVPTNPDGYISDDDQYSLQDYGLTDLAALCELAPSDEADALLALLAQSLIAVDSFHMARTMCGLAVCP